MLAVLAAAAAASAAPGGWNVYLDASAVNGITIIGDSLWCATGGGVLLYDPADSTFTQFADGLALRSNDITAVTVDGRGSIWAAMRAAGIARIDDPLAAAPHVTQYSAAISGLLSDSVTCLLRIGPDVYYGGTNGVAKFFEQFPTSEPNLTDNLEGRTVYDMAYDPATDLLWIAAEGGVAGFNRGTFAYTWYPIGRARSICVHQGEIYCAAAEGVLVFGDGAWSVFGSGLHMEPLAVASGGGALWCITPESAYLWSGSLWVHQETSALKTLLRREYIIFWGDNILRALGVDRAGVPWVGGFKAADRRGAYLWSFSGGQWRNAAPAGLPQNQIVALDADAAGNLWVSTGRFGIAYRAADSGAWVAYTKIRSDTGDDNALSFHVNNLALLGDGQGYLWCNALNFDLDRLDIGDPFDRSDDVWAHYSLGEGTITSNRFVRAVEDPAGNRWFLSDADFYLEERWGINIASAAGNNWLSVNPSTHPAMEVGSVFDCAFDQTGVFLALRGFGVKYWHTGGFGWNTLTSTTGDYWVTVAGQGQLPSTELWAIERGADGSIWIATSGGLVRYRDGRYDTYGAKTDFDGQGLLGGAVYDLAGDRHGNVWAATSRGLNRIAPDGTITGAFTTASLWLAELQFVHSNDVVSPLPHHVCKSLAYDAADDVLWVGTDGGLARLDVSPDEVRPLALPQAILYPNPVHISRGDNALRIWRISGTVGIRVYTLEGELVHEAHGVAEGGVAWDLLTVGGFRASAGIYIVEISADGRAETRKVAVVR